MLGQRLELSLFIDEPLIWIYSFVLSLFKDLSYHFSKCACLCLFSCLHVIDIIVSFFLHLFSWVGWTIWWSCLKRWNPSTFFFICLYFIAHLFDSFCFPNLKNWNPNFIQELKVVQVGYSFCFLFKVKSVIDKSSLRYHFSSVVSPLTSYYCLFVTFVIVFVVTLTCCCHWVSSIIIMVVC